VIVQKLALVNGLKLASIPSRAQAARVSHRAGVIIAPHHHRRQRHPHRIRYLHFQCASQLRPDRLSSSSFPVGPRVGNLSPEERTRKDLTYEKRG